MADSNDPEAGSREAAQALWAEHRARLRSFVRRRVGCAEDADDIVQEVWLRFLAKPPRSGAGASALGWLYQVAANAVVDHYRARRPQAELPDDLRADEPAPDVLAELSECVRPLLNTLAPAYRDALVLSELDGLPQRDVAEQLGLSLSGAKSRIQRGRAQLRESVERCCAIERSSRGLVDYSPRSGTCGDAGRCCG
jgi:RNA polymerase sigma-70 factor (ECF subfamily)